VCAGTLVHYYEQAVRLRNGAPRSVRPWAMAFLPSIPNLVYQYYLYATPAGPRTAGHRGAPLTHCLLMLHLHTLAASSSRSRTRRL